MEYPTLNTSDTYREPVEVFGGYNHNLRISEGEFYDMDNLTSSYYPVIAPRKQRGIYKTPTTKPTGMIWKDAFCYVTHGIDNNLYFCMNGKDYNLGPTTVPAEEERTIVSMGAYAIIFPDKKYVNVKSASGEDFEDKGNIEATYSSDEYGVNEIKYQMCRADGTSYDINVTSPEKPTNAGEDSDGKPIPIPNGYVWLDTSTTPSSLKVYSSANAMWSAVATTYIKISATNIGTLFNVYDGVKISGVLPDPLQDLNNTMVIYAKGEDNNSIVVIGVMDDAEYVQKDPIKVERLMPTMDFVIESNNRLWGCHYGIVNGEPVNILYASKLGDFKNWFCYMNVSTDSYYVNLGTDGQFTGAISYLGMPTFFKENCIHTVYGEYPANFRVQDISCRGVQRDSHKSLAMVNEVLYYKSRNGICAYNGSLPTEISSVLGENSYSNAVGCAHKNKYYVSMKDSSTGEFDMFVYDTTRGIWHKEKDFEVKAFYPVDEEVYYITSDGATIGTMFGSGTKDESPVKWMAETGVLGCSSPDKKYISRISIRLAMELGSRIVFSIQYDSMGEWEAVCTCVGNTLRTFTMPIRPRRCDHFRLRIEGTGNAKIFSITKTLEQGSEL